MATVRKRHYWLLWIGFLIPIVWIIGRADRAHRANRRAGAKDGVAGARVNNSSTLEG